MSRTQSLQGGEKKTEYQADILVIGGGIAGFYAAIRAREMGQSVLLVDKGVTGTSGFTPWANSFCYFDASLGDDREEWLHNVQHVSEYLVNLDYYNMFIDDSFARYNELVDWGIFSPDRDRHVEFRTMLKRKDVELVERVMITDLLVSDGRVVGAIGFHMESDDVLTFRAKATVMCAGAGAYKAPGYPIHSQTFDGDAMAYHIGATISGKEFCDFHFTSDKYPAEAWALWSEEFIGEVVPTPGPKWVRIPFLQPVFEIHAGGPPGPPFDPERLGPPEVRQPSGPRRFPPVPKRPEGNTVLGAATGLGIHKSEGIWPADDKCFSGVPGLFAAGDALASMMCGTWYPNLGTSMAGSAVQGYRAGESAADFARTTDYTDVPSEERALIAERMLAPLKREKGFDPRWVGEVLLSTMAPYYVLFVKEKGRLEAALENVTFMRRYLTPRLRAGDTHELRLAHETENMALNAEMKLRAALYRTESRGTHYRTDFPSRDDRNWLAWILIKKDQEGNMTLAKTPVPDAWRYDLDRPYEERYPNPYPDEVQSRIDKSGGGK